MGSFLDKVKSAFSTRRHSKQIDEMLKRGRERDKNEPIKKTAHQLEQERKIAESMKINNEESLV